MNEAITKAKELYSIFFAVTSDEAKAKKCVQAHLKELMKIEAVPDKSFLEDVLKQTEITYKLSDKEKIKHLERYMITQFNLQNDFASNNCRRQDDYVIPRYVFWYCLVERENISAQLIEDIIPGKDRCSVIAGVKAIRNMLDTKQTDLIKKYLHLLV